MTVPAPIHKTCGLCRTPKPVTAYHWRNRARGVRHSSCKACRCEDERERYAALPYPPGLWKDDAPRPLPSGYGMTPGDVAAMDEAAESEDPFPPVAYGMTPERAAAALKWLKDIQNIPATTPASVVDPADACADLDPMGNGSAWGWVTVAAAAALVALVGIIVWVSA